MAISLIFLLYAYLAFVFMWCIMSLGAIYHLIKFGPSKFFSAIVLLVYATVSLAIFSVSYGYMSELPWSMSFAVFQNFTNVDSL